MKTSETPTGSQSPDIEKTINEGLDNAFNLAIDQAIEVVKSEYQTVKAIGEGEKYYEIFNNIAMKIRNLLKTNQ